MPDEPIAYHITVGTYGTRLHGDERGTVDRKRNRPGEPILGRNDAWNQAERNQLRFEPIRFSIRQRHHLEVAVPEICRKGGWRFQIAAARPDHIHVLLSAEADGKIVRRLLKRWLSQELSKYWPLADEQVWWADSGSIKWIWTEDYFCNVFDYIDQQKSIQPETD